MIYHRSHTETSTLTILKNETFDDEEFITAAAFLHRQFILNLDYIQRQIFYHRRYVTYLISPITHAETNIAPSIYHQDLMQESDALEFVDLRLKALRNRTVSILEMVCYTPPRNYQQFIS